jgi:hypothetical protein
LLKIAAQSATVDHAREHTIFENLAILPSAVSMVIPAVPEPGGDGQVLL